MHPSLQTHKFDIITGYLSFKMSEKILYTQTNIYKNCKAQILGFPGASPNLNMTLSHSPNVKEVESDIYKNWLVQKH